MRSSKKKSRPHEAPPAPHLVPPPPETHPAPVGFDAHRKRQRLFLNPYTDFAFTKCPRCERPTRVRMTPLVIHIEPVVLLVFNKKVRLCPHCELVIVSKAMLEAYMATHFEAARPEIVGNDYVVCGTLDRSDWRALQQRGAAPDEILDAAWFFEDVWEFQLVGGWHMPHGSEPRP